MWRIALVLVTIGALFYAVRVQQQARFEREETARKLEAMQEEIRAQKPVEREQRADVPSDAELKAAAQKVLGDLVEQETPKGRSYEIDGEPALPVVKEPELRAHADVSWSVTESNNSWHRVSYSITLRSAVDRTLTIDLTAKALTSGGLPIDDKTHRNIILPASGRAVVIADYMLVTCPACYNVFTVGGDINIKAAR